MKRKQAIPKSYLLALLSFILIIQVTYSQKDTLPPIPYFKMDCAGNFYHPTDYKKHPFVTDMPEDDQNRCNLAYPFFDKSSGYNFEFTFDYFEMGKTRTTDWNLEIIDPDYDGFALIIFTDFCMNDTVLKINYFTPKFKIYPSQVSFKLKPGETVSKVITLKSDAMGGVHNLRFLTLNSILMKLEETGFQITHDFTPDEEIIKGKDYNFTISFTGKEIGTFKDSISVGDSCRISNKCGLIAIVSDENSVDEPSAEFSISPNPASEYINIDLSFLRMQESANGCHSERSEESKIKISDIFGNNVLSVETGLRPVSTRIDVSSLPVGVYFVRIGNEKPMKFVKL